MADEKVWIEVNGKELASLEPNMEDEGGGQAAIGGSIICRSVFGVPVVTIDGGGEHGSPSAQITIQNGGFSIYRGGNSRVKIHPGDELEGEDGGTIMLDAEEQTSAVILN